MPVGRVSRGADKALQRRRRQRQHLAALLAVTALTLTAAYAIKSPCLHTPWSTGVQYTQRCYNDVQVLYVSRGFNLHAFPYVGHGGRTLPDGTPLGFVEYPVLTGMLMWLESFAAHGRASFFAANAMWMALAALATTVCLWAFGSPTRRLLFWCAAPSLAFYAFYNWDLLAVLLATAGLLAFQRGRPAASGALLALGACAKIYPALFLPVLGCALLRREGRLGPQGLRFGIAAVATLAAVNGPFLAWDLLHPNPGAHPNLWLTTFTFHLGRPANTETLWAIAAHYAHQAGQPALARALLTTLPKAAGIGILAGVAGFSWLAWRGHMGWPQACFAALLLFLLLNKVFSIQYALWVLPFLALLDLPWPAKVAFLAGDLLVFVTIWPFLLASVVHQPLPYGPLVFAMVLRAASLAGLLACVVRRPLHGMLPGWQASEPPAAQRPSAQLLPDGPA